MAVRALKHGVERYAEHVRDALGQARRDMAAADRKANEAVEGRRTEMQRCERNFREAEAALRQCQENCGGVQRQVAEAAQRHAEAKQGYDKARKAAQITATAQSELAKAGQTVESAVGQHSSVASSALASLDAKLADLPKFGLGDAVHSALATTAVTAEVLAHTVGFGRIAGNALQAANINNSFKEDSITEMVEHRQDQERDYKVQKDFEHLKHLNSGEAGVTES